MTALLKKKPQLLTELEITEISLVDKASNPGAQVLVYKNVADPSNVLGLSLLRVLQRRVENVRRNSNINRLEAWAEVLGTPEGQQLLELVTKMKSDSSLIFKDMEDKDVSELCDFVEGPHLDAFVKALRGELKKGITVPKEMEVVEKILKKQFEGQIEATKTLQLELVKKAKADDRRTPEKRLVDYLDNHPEIEDAIRELPDLVKVEETQERDYGPTYRKIKKKATELVKQGAVSSEAKAFCKVVEDNPSLWVEYLQEQV